MHLRINNFIKQLKLKNAFEYKSLLYINGTESDLGVEGLEK